MPSTRIVTGSWADDCRPAVLEAVCKALSLALKLPEWDKDIVIDIYDENSRIYPAGRTERYTRVETTLFPGRSLEAKRALFRAIVDNLGELGVPPTDVKITLIEVSQENWGLRGGYPASEIDLGFKIDV